MTSYILLAFRQQHHVMIIAMMIADISVYNTCTLLLNNEKDVDANLDAPDNANSGNEPSSEMLTSQRHKLE